MSPFEQQRVIDAYWARELKDSSAEDIDMIFAVLFSAQALELIDQEVLLEECDEADLDEDEIVAADDNDYGEYMVRNGQFYLKECDDAY